MNPALSADSSHEELIGQAAGEFFEAVSRGERLNRRICGTLPGHCRAHSPHFSGIARCGRYVSRTSGDMLVRAVSERTLGDFGSFASWAAAAWERCLKRSSFRWGGAWPLRCCHLRAGTGESLQRFRNEVRAAAALDHPHIVSVYSIGEERACTSLRCNSSAGKLWRMRSLNCKKRSSPNRGPAIRRSTTPC